MIATPTVRFKPQQASDFWLTAAEGQSDPALAPAQISCLARCNNQFPCRRCT